MLYRRHAARTICRFRGLLLNNREKHNPYYGKIIKEEFTMKVKMDVVKVTEIAGHVCTIAGMLLGAWATKKSNYNTLKKLNRNYHKKH